MSLLLIELFIDKAQDAGELVVQNSLLFLFVVAWLYNFSVWLYSSSVAGNALAESAWLQNKPSFTEGKKMFCLTHKKNTVNTTAE